MIMATIDTSDLVNANDAARILGLTHGRVCQLIRAGALPAIKLNARAWLISRKDLTAFSKKNRPAGNPTFIRKPEKRSRK